MESITVIMHLLVFLCTALAVEGAYNLYKDIAETAEKKKLLARLWDGSEPDGTRVELFRKQRGRGGLYQMLSRHALFLRLEVLLLQARINISPSGLILTSIGCSIISVIAGLFLVGFSLLLFPVAVSALLLPLLYVWRRLKKRAAVLEEQLPEAVELMARGLRAGQSLDMVLQEVGAQFPDPVGPETGRMCEEIALGIPFETALKNFEKHLPPLTDIRIFCTALIIQRKTGGDLTMILDGLSATIRNRFKLKGQIKVLTAEARMSCLIIGILPVGFGVLVYLVNPDYLRPLFVDPLGRKLLFAAGVLEVAGFIVMKMLTKVKV